MILSFTTFATMMFFSIIGLIFLTAYIYNDVMGLVKDVKFHLDQRTLKHNQDKAKLSIMKTKFEKVQVENKKLKAQIDYFKQDVQFSDISETEFVEKRDQHIKKLGSEISSIQAALNGDFKEKLNDYKAEVDRLNRRLVKAQDEFSTHMAEKALDELDPKNIA